MSLRIYSLLPFGTFHQDKIYIQGVSADAWLSDNPEVDIAWIPYWIFFGKCWRMIKFCGKWYGDLRDIWIADVEIANDHRLWITSKPRKRRTQTNYPHYPHLIIMKPSG